MRRLLVRFESFFGPLMKVISVLLKCINGSFFIQVGKYVWIEELLKTI